MNLIDQEKPEARERLTGVLVEWNDSRGFGWVEVKGKRRFAHVRDFGRTGRRPKNGEEVTFIAGKLAGYQSLDFSILPGLIRFVCCPCISFSTLQLTDKGEDC